MVEEHKETEKVIEGQNCYVWIWFQIKKSVYFTIQLIFTIIYESHFTFDTIYEFHCTISTNFYFYL